jgi:hypothetical protein
VTLLDTAYLIVGLCLGWLTTRTFTTAPQPTKEIR